MVPRNLTLLNIHIAQFVRNHRTRLISHKISRTSMLVGKLSQLPSMRNIKEWKSTSVDWKRVRKRRRVWEDHIHTIDKSVDLKIINNHKLKGRRNLFQHTRKSSQNRKERLTASIVQGWSWMACKCCHLLSKS